MKGDTWVSDERWGMVTEAYDTWVEDDDILIHILDYKDEFLKLVHNGEGVAMREAVIAEAMGYC